MPSNYFHCQSKHHVGPVDMDPRTNTPIHRNDQFTHRDEWVSKDTTNRLHTVVTHNACRVCVDKEYEAVRPAAAQDNTAPLF